MIKATITFEEEDIKYLKKHIPLKMRSYLSALANGYGIDKAILYHVFVAGRAYYNCTSEELDK